MAWFSGKKKKIEALLEASEKGHADVVKALLSSGADVNVKRNDGFTALLKSC